MQTDYIDKKTMEHLLAALTVGNALACRVSLATGLRIGDVLRLRTAQLRRQRFTIREQKTGKSRRIYLPKALWKELQLRAGEEWVFPGRNPAKHRTRQAVWRDVKRAQKAFRISGNLGPHSMRKIAAVEALRRTGDLSRVQNMLNHDNIETTLLYAMSDVLKRQTRKKKKRPP
jgi:integrase